MANDDEVFKNFLIEIAERLAEFDQGLRELEQAMTSPVAKFAPQAATKPSS